MTKLETLLYRTLPIVSEVAQFIQDQLGKVGQDEIESKDLNSLVSYVDRTAEERLVAGLADILPEAVFLTEEGTVEQSASEQSGEVFRWIIDPLDGTTNFLHGVPYFAVSVALQKGDETVLGIVHEVGRDEQFYAWKGGGAWMNGRRIQVSKTTDLKDSLVSTGFPYHDFELMEQYLDAFRFFMKNTRGLRRFGAAAVDLAWVACGRFEVFFEHGLAPWDVAAGALLVEEAGGTVCDFKGGADYLFGGEMIAAGPGIIGDVKKNIAEAFAK